MRRFFTFAASLMLAVSMLVAPDMAAQSRSSNTSSSRSTTGSSSRSSSSVSSNASRAASSSAQVRSSSSSSSSQVRSGSSSSQVRSSNSSGSSRSSAVSSGATPQVRSGNSAASASSRSSGVSSSASSRSSSVPSTSTPQVRNSGNSSAGSSSRSSSVSSSASSRSSSVSSNTAKSTGVTSSAQSRSSAVSSAPVNPGNGVNSSNTVNSANNGTAATSNVARSSNVSRNGLGVDAVATSSGNSASGNTVKEAYRDDSFNYRYEGDMRVDDRHNMYRIPPRQRDPMPWDRPGFFYGDMPHYYGYRIHSLPPQYRRISHWGIDYYFYNGIYYRPFGGAYVVCRPPFGTPLEAAIDRAILRAIRFAYYCDTYRTYERTFDYYNIIARQNLIIAQQNARIIAQNANYAINGTRALSAYELANKLGLVQSYAYANSEYYYQDGVFYTISASGLYTTIVPPAGALVTSLPDDYETIVMNGIEYYMVDNTVYRTTLFEGQPYLEVLGQMYGSLYSQYNVYR